MAVDASDRKLYLMAAERSESGKQALKDFDTELNNQSSAAAQRDTDFQLHTGSPPSAKLAASSPKAPVKESGTTDVQEKLISRGYDLGKS